MRNLGNTCFASAAVWALGACPRAVRAVASSRGDRELARLLASVMRNPSSPDWPQLVRRIDKLIDRRGREPHDSHELICALVDSLKMDSHFCVNLVTGIKCGACGNAGTKRETNIYITSEPAASVAAGLTAAHSPRWVEGRDCDEGCKRRCRAAMRTVPKGPPPGILMVRVSPGKSGLWIEHSFGYCGSTYRLRSVIMYRGNGDGGHYVCGVWDAGKWRVHDDDQTRGVTVTTVSGASLLQNAHTVLYEMA